MFKGSIGALALGVSSLALSAPALATETLHLTVAMGHPEVFLWVKHIHETFIPVLAQELGRTGEVEVEWTEAYGGTLVRLGSEIEAFQTGIMDVGQLSGVFDPAGAGILNISYAMPFGPTDSTLVTQASEAALRESGALDVLQEATGVVYIGGGIAIDNYNIGANREIHTLEDMNGLRIGGAPSNHAWLDGSGAVAVAAGYPNFYNDIQTGVYSGHMGFITASTPARLYEVAPYWNEVNFGSMYIGGLGVSQERWDSFSESTREAFRTAAAAYSTAYLAEQTARIEAARAAYEAGGGHFVAMDAAERQHWIDAMANPTTAFIAAGEARGEPARQALELYRAYLADHGFAFDRDYLAE
ncbi:MAG: TRAP transporter substrate-binding protein DctP [Rhodobacteraceae bacterium]|nr:TRAP transporter substrate-binding protein DctP [Paracoccaceae bacterium]